MRAYRSARAWDAEAVAQWTPVIAAARLAEGIDEERETLLALAAG